MEHAAAPYIHSVSVQDCGNALLSWRGAGLEVLKGLMEVLVIVCFTYWKVVWSHGSLSLPALGF